MTDTTAGMSGDMPEKNHKTGLFLIGCISIPAQVILLRELNAAFYGVDLICILAMGVWLFWTAAGVMTGRRNHIPSEKALSRAFLLFAFFLPLEIILIRFSPVLSGAVPGTYLSLEKQMTVIFLSLLPAAFLTGLLFQWAAKRFVSAKQTLALAYAIECTGGLTGGLASALFPLWGISNLTASLICALISAGAAFLCVPVSEKIRHGRNVSVPVFLFLLIILYMSPRGDEFLNRFLYPDMVAVQDSPDGRIRISVQSGLYSVFENNALLFDTESTGTEELVHPAALQCASPERVMIAGGGFSGIAGEILRHQPRHTDIAEINPVLEKIVRKHLPAAFTAFPEFPGVFVHHADPRQFLKNASPYDLIIVGCPEPDSGQSNRFYTLEFFQICARKLSPEGVVAFRMASSENLWTPSLRMRNAAVYTALRSVFADVVVLPGTMNTVMASHQPLIRDPEKLISRFRERQPDTRLISPEFIRYLYTNDRFSAIRDMLSDQKIAPNTDFRPVCYQYTALIWLSRLIPSLMHRDISSLSLFLPESGANMLLYGLGFAVFGLMTGTEKIFPVLGKSFRIFAAAFAAMVMETVLILRYQAQSGAMFLHIGILLMIFMAGMAAGSLSVTKLAQMRMSASVRKHTGRCLLTGFALLCLTVHKLLPREAAGEIFPVSVFLFLTAFFLSAVFAWLSLSDPGAQQELVSPLYAADLAGACLGSMAASLFLIPFTGMMAAAGFMAVLLLAAAVSP